MNMTLNYSENSESLVESIRKVCESIYEQLGSAHNECVYQKALSIELFHYGAITVEIEKHVPVFFTDSRQIRHTIGSERVDLYARFPNCVILFELKATIGTMKKSEINQIVKYKEAIQILNEPVDCMLLVNFTKNGTQIEFLVID
tara:strand:- start:45 stop:479 length:435 start_codon:yes stop_codon:yes gene_type:complete